MSVVISPYIHFAGNARAALQHYADVLGGDPQIVDYASSGITDVPGITEVDPHAVFHGELVTTIGPTILAADSAHPSEGQRVTITLSGDAADHDTLARAFEGLADEGTIEQPFALAPWGSFFGSLTDRFGVNWYFSTNVE